MKNNSNNQTESKQSETNLDKARTLGMKQHGWIHGGATGRGCCCPWSMAVN